MYLHWSVTCEEILERIFNTFTMFGFPWMCIPTTRRTLILTYLLTLPRIRHRTVSPYHIVSKMTVLLNRKSMFDAHVAYRDGPMFEHKVGSHGVCHTCHSRSLKSIHAFILESLAPINFSKGERSCFASGNERPVLSLPVSRRSCEGCALKPWHGKAATSYPVR